MNQIKLENLTNEILQMSDKEKLDMLPAVLGLLRAQTKRGTETEQKVINDQLHQHINLVKQWNK